MSGVENGGWAVSTLDALAALRERIGRDSADGCGSEVGIADDAGAAATTFCLRSAGCIGSVFLGLVEGDW